jgi:DNA-binding response OmpR family regulator
MSQASTTWELPGIAASELTEADVAVHTVEIPRYFEFYNGRAELDFDARQLFFDKKPAHLQPRAFNLIAYLGSTPGIVHADEHIFDAVWPECGVFQGERRTLKQHVSIVRRATDKGIIVNEKGIGYFAPE